MQVIATPSHRLGRTTRQHFCQFFAVSRMFSLPSVDQPQLVRGHENILVLQLDGEAEFLAHLLQIGLHHPHVPASGHFDLADEHELRAVAVAVEIDDVDVLAGEVLAKAADDAGLIFAEQR